MAFISKSRVSVRRTSSSKSRSKRSSSRGKSRGHNERAHRRHRKVRESSKERSASRDIYRSASRKSRNTTLIDEVHDRKTATIVQESIEEDDDAKSIMSNIQEEPQTSR